MSYEVRLTREAEKMLNRLDRSAERRIRQRIVHRGSRPQDRLCFDGRYQGSGRRDADSGSWALLCRRVGFGVDHDGSRNGGTAHPNERAGDRGGEFEVEAGGCR